MILNWKKPGAGVLVIPVMNKDKAIIDNLIIAPGHNEVSNEDWEGAKVHCQEHIKNGFLEPVEKEVPIIDEKTEKPTGKKVKKFVSIKDLNPEEADKIIKETYHLETLLKWKAKEDRDAVRVVLLNQIEEIEKPGK